MPYGTCGTELGYGAVRRAVLSQCTATECFELAATGRLCYLPTALAHFEQGGRTYIEAKKVQ
eukprot:3896408-Rhodomonas_salina.1